MEFTAGWGWGTWIAFVLVTLLVYDVLSDLVKALAKRRDCDCALCQLKRLRE